MSAASGSERKAAGRKSAWQSLALVFDFWRERKLLAFLLFAGTGVMTGLSLVFPYVLRYIIDGVRNGVAEPTLLRYVLLLVLLGLFRALGESVLPWNRGRVNERYQWVVRSRVFRSILDKGHSFANRFPTGDVMERLDHDLGELSWFACSGIFRSVSAFFSVVLALAFMLSMNPMLTLATVLPLGVAAVVWVKLGPRVFARYMEWRRKISETNNLIESALSGVRLVKSYTMEERLERRFRGGLDERVSASVATTRVEARINVFYMAVVEMGVLLVLWLGGFLVVRGTLTLGEFVAFNGYVLLLVGPMFDIGNLFVSGRRAQAGSERVGEMERHPAEVPASAARRPGGAEGQNGEGLRLENVTFSYERDKGIEGQRDRGEEKKGDEVNEKLPAGSATKAPGPSPFRPALRNVTLDFPAGTRTGIAGTVGSGKSSVFRLLFRLADPDEGRVLLDGRDARELDLDSYRAHFGYAPQEATLFSDSLRENVAFGRAASDEELMRIVELVQLGEDVKGFAKGLDEKLGERGARLSGGQKERVAIARAVVGGPPVFVFDDATSALDAETEKELVRRLSEESGSSTVIIVSHRLSILAGCDRIYVMDEGEVKEQGTHEELLARRGLYWKLYQRQLIEEEIERL